MMSTNPPDPVSTSKLEDVSTKNHVPVLSLTVIDNISVTRAFDEPVRTVKHVEHHPTVLLHSMHFTHPVPDTHAATGLTGAVKFASFGNLWSAWVHSEVRGSQGQRMEVRGHRTITNVTNTSVQPALLAAIEDTGPR